jgi:sporulation protein YlmC with PRC-barrel domain
MTVLKASDVHGNDVKDPSGESLGDVKDLVIDVDTGKVAYAVVQFGGLFGIGSKLFAVPLQAMSRDADDECFVLNTTKAELEQATGFDKDHWPDFADRTWQTTVHEQFRTTPYWH